MKLLKDWKQCPQWWSQRINAIIMSISLLQGIAAVWETALPASTFATITAILATASMIARVLDQQLNEEVSDGDS